MSQFRGKTEDAGAPFLTAAFWKPSKSIAGTVIREFETDNGRAYGILLVTPVMVNDKTEKQISMGNSAGFRMAVDASGAPGGLLVGDKVHIECTGFTGTDKGNDMVNFSVEINRDEPRAARA